MHHIEYRSLVCRFHSSLETVSLILHFIIYTLPWFSFQKLNAAFHNSPEVRLMFSVNNSSAFQGYAVMRSAIGNLGRPVLWSGGVTFGSPFAGTEVHHDDHLMILSPFHSLLIHIHMSIPNLYCSLCCSRVEMPAQPPVARAPEPDESFEREQPDPQGQGLPGAPSGDRGPDRGAHGGQGTGIRIKGPCPCPLLGPDPSPYA